MIFLILTAAVIIAGAIGSAAGWQVQPVRPTPIKVEHRDASGQVILKADGTPELVNTFDERGVPRVELKPVGEAIKARSLLNGDGLYWMMSSMLRNFTGLPALGLIFVAMLGIGLAEKFGFFSASMRALAIITPRRFLTPMVVLIGANSSVASDAGYVILPPLAAALYLAVGRHPLAGLAAAFAGVAGGFGAGFFPTGGDGAITGFAQDGARILSPDYSVNILHNAFFKAASALVVMIGGWVVTDALVEPRLMRTQPLKGLAGSVDGGGEVTGMSLASVEKRALVVSAMVMGGVLAVFGALIFIPGMPLNDVGLPTLPDGRVIVHHPVEVLPAHSATTTPATDVLSREPLMVVESGVRGRLVESPGARWSHVIVPIIFFSFLLPGMTYGVMTGTLRTQRDFIDGLYHGIRGIVPVLVIAFFLGQFVNYFAYTRLDRMLAYSGGSLLFDADLPTPVLIALFVLVVILGDFCISGMLSKFGILAPIFIPMFMMVGISPELTTAAYRIGDSVVNIVTPLNSYLLIILVVLQKYKKGAGLGSLISLMLPYSVALFLLWTALLLVWMATGLPLGPGSALNYEFQH